MSKKEKTERSTNKTYRQETVEEYFARGGKVTRIETPKVEEGVSSKKEVTVRSTSNIPIKLMTLEEGAYYFAEKNQSSVSEEQIVEKKKEAQTKIDELSGQLTPELRAKLGL